MRPIISTLCLAFGCFAAETLEAAELKQETSNAFSRYIVLTEERMARSLHDGDSFYSMGGKPELQREALRIRLRQGEIIVDQMETLDGERTIKVPGGLVHHWIALGFIPGVNLNQALALLQDYEQYPVVYQPDVKRSKLLRNAFQYLSPPLSEDHCYYCIQRRIRSDVLPCGRASRTQPILFQADRRGGKPVPAKGARTTCRVRPRLFMAALQLLEA